MHIEKNCRNIHQILNIRNYLRIVVQTVRPLSSILYALLSM
jgi:hypothetical protein